MQRNPGVSLVVDDLAPTDPWVVRGVELRGSAEALVDSEPPMGGMSREVIRITLAVDRKLGHHPRRPRDVGPDLT